MLLIKISDSIMNKISSWEITEAQALVTADILDKVEKLEPQIQEYSNIFEFNEKVSMHRQSMIEIELKKFEDKLQAVDFTANEILHQQIDLNTELAQIESMHPRPKDFFSSSSLKSMDSRQEIRLNHRLASRYLTDGMKILSKVNPSKQYSSFQCQDDEITEIERQIVLFT